jgi:hypothetical protein
MLAWLRTQLSRLPKKELAVEVTNVYCVHINHMNILETCEC